MSSKLFLLIILITCCLFASCQNNPVNTEEKFQPGRRDYTWTIDTLKVPEGSSNPSRIWGTDGNNIWAVGHSYLNGYHLWHYDGETWMNYNPHMYWDPYAIFGTSHDNIWIGSSDGSFWHYDGKKWSKFSTITIPNHYPFVCQNMCGSAQNNIYAVGHAVNLNNDNYKAVIFHFDGKKWIEMNIPLIRASIIQIKYDYRIKTFFITAVNFESGKNFLYQMNENGIDTLYSQKSDLVLEQIKDRVYVVINTKIFRIENRKLVEFKDFSGTQYAGKICGRNETDFFTINWDGIGHYNGIDLITIFQKGNNNWFPTTSIIFEKDVFFIWDDELITFVIHGKLD